MTVSEFTISAISLQFLNIQTKTRFLDRIMDFEQRKFQLPPFSRGFHLITHEVAAAIPEVQAFKVGMLQLFIQHTSASLTINENCDPDVRHDMELGINHIVPESLPYVHTCEGPDDMPAHLKSSLMGSSLLIPVSEGKLNLGTWQGIYLCEHRNRASGRKIVATLFGLRRG